MSLPEQKEAAAGVLPDWRLCSLLVAIFIFACTFAAVRKDVTIGFDEVAHASYIAHQQRYHELWPPLRDMRMIDPRTFEFTDQRNYLNHPSPYYLALAYVGPALEGRPGAIIVHRLINVALAAIGLAAFLALGLIARLPRLMFYCYVAPIICIPALAPLGGSVNNDNLAFAGAGVATLAAWQLLTNRSGAAFAAALGGLIVASWVKFTAFLLIGGMLAAIMVWMLSRGRLPRWWIGPAVLAALLGFAPYAVLFVQYGSPTPEVPGLIDMLRSEAHAAGWDDAERMSLNAYVPYFIWTFIVGWMPAPMPRNLANYAALLIPVTAVFCALAGCAASVLRLTRKNEAPLDVMVTAGALAFTATFALHIMFSYQQHVNFGWLLGAYPRYYLPLAALVPLAGLSFLSTVKLRRASMSIAVFLIAGPIVFDALGASLR